MCFKHASFTYTVTRERYLLQTLWDTIYFVNCSHWSAAFTTSLNYWSAQVIISADSDYKVEAFGSSSAGICRGSEPASQPLPLPILDMPTCIPLFSPPWQRRMLLSRSLGQSPPRLGAAALANSSEDQPFSRKQLWSEPHCEVFIVDLI